jgi:hypothetical protein
MWLALYIFAGWCWLSVLVALLVGKAMRWARSERANVDDSGAV